MNGFFWLCRSPGLWRMWLEDPWKTWSLAWRLLPGFTSDSPISGYPRVPRVKVWSSWCRRLRKKRLPLNLALSFQSLPTSCLPQVDCSIRVYPSSHSPMPYPFHTCCHTQTGAKHASLTMPAMFCLDSSIRWLCFTSSASVAPTTAEWYSNKKFI